MSQADVLSHIGEPTAICGQPFSACVYAEGRGAAWVSAVGELDLVSAPGFAWTLSRALDRALLLVVDLRELTFIDAAGIGVIVQADAVARRTGHRIVFVNGT